jgi:hypothetical protein
MFNRYTLIVLAAVVALAAVLLRDTEEDRILAQLEELRTRSEIHAPESGIELLVRSRQLGEFFTESTFYDFTGSGNQLYEIPSRQELVQRIARIRAKLASLELTLQEKQVSIEGDTASVLLRGTGLGSIRGEDGQFLEIHSIEIRLEKPEDTWLVAGARHLRNERNPLEQSNRKIHPAQTPPWKTAGRLAYHGRTQ